MSVRKSKNSEREQAEHWAARLAAPDCSSRERMAFEQWRGQDPARREAFAATERLLTAVDDLAATDRRLEALMDKARGDGSSARVARWVVPTALAASLTFAVAGLYLYTDFFGRAPEPVRYATDTAPGSITLDDGSVIHLDAASQVVTRMSGSKRSVELTQGRALFDVVHDAGKPFTVRAGTANVSVLGTQFQVERLNVEGKSERVLVTLAEGAVNVWNDPQSGGSRQQERLLPGDQMLYSAESATWTKRRVDPQVATSWRRGRLAFRGAPLEDVLVEVNRYSAQKIRIGDPSLAALPIQGNLFVGDPAAIASAVQAIVPLRVEQQSNGDLLLFSSPAPPPR